MLTPADFPRLKLCVPCSRLFTDYKDESRADYNSIQHHMWYEEDGYGYTRIRDDLEHAAIFGCVFCRGVTSRDHKYKEGHSIDTTEVCFDEPRPAWYPSPYEDLELRIRYNWVDNMLYIWSRRGVDWSGGDLSWSIYATPNDPSATKVHAQAVLTQLGSLESFAMARNWMNECLANHENCPPKRPAELPTRVIEVSSLGQPDFARLCETDGQKGYYCALSYCWGGDQDHKTIRKRYDQYKKELPYVKLPKTITDAFQVTRSMGLRYIWIDSLCIIQDSNEDKQTEMDKMMHIYQNTQFTISAASALDVTHGFLQTQLDDPSIGAFYQPLRIDEQTTGSVLISESSPSFACVGAHQQPINTRGWTLQETLYSSRLLIFTNIHMVWKCQAGYQPDFHATSRSSRERYGRESPWDFWSSLCGYSFESLKQLDETPTPEAPKTGEKFNSLGGLYVTWHSILRQYSERRLTIENDRLPAISAVAQAFASPFKSEYYAGLWGRFLVHDLMWKNWLSNSNVTKSGGPSWSWATINGEHAYARSNSLYARARVISCKTTLVSDRNPFGEVTGGKLVIRGHLTKVWLDPKERLLLDDEGCVIADAQFTSDGAFGDWETSLDSDHRNCIAVTCLVLGDTRWHMSIGDRPLPESTQCQMMVLTKSPDQEGYYQRVGFAEAGCDYAPYWWEECDRVTITVV